MCVVFIREFSHVTRTISGMALQLITPPTMRTLLQDDAFRKMMKTRPRVPASLVYAGSTPAWHVWVLMMNDKWKRGKFHTYDEAYRKMKDMLGRDDVQDVSVTCIRLMFAPPVGFDWQWEKYPWCARCRRPSLFFERLTHRAINFEQITYDEPYRCFYCGIRKVALPRHSPR